MCMMPLIYPVASHTAQVGPGSTFVAIKGFKEDGVDFIPEALARGASTLVVQRDAYIPPSIMAQIYAQHAELIAVENTRHSLAELSAAAAGYPARTLTLIGFTGTKGKTTSVYLLEHVLRMNGFKVARITGVTNMINGVELPASLTTPQPDYLHQFLKLCVAQQVTHVIMEVAAQALSLHRIETLQFDAALFTNLGREHFELYESMEQYCAVKQRIFAYTHDTALRLVNAHDRWTSSLRDPHGTIQTYGFDIPADYQAYDATAHPTASFIRNGIRISCPRLIGLYNAQNLLGVTLVAERYGLTGAQINQALSSFPGIPGRMERYTLPGDVTAVIDYAHNPSSYEALLSTLRPLTTHLIVLFGASGTRDKGKRPLMGHVAALYADQIILTADNPGPEDPEHIIACIKEGIPADKLHIVITEPDRHRAIEIAYAQAKAGSIIALLGKGPDEYQIIQGNKSVFSERALLHTLQEREL